MAEDFLDDDKLLSIFLAWELLGDKAGIEPEAYQYAFDLMDRALRARLSTHGLDTDEEVMAAIQELRAETQE